MCYYNYSNYICVNCFTNLKSFKQMQTFQTIYIASYIRTYVCLLSRVMMTYIA